MFPGFDLLEDSTTPSPRKRRRQAYSKLIRLFLQNTKDRIQTIRDVIRDEGDLHFRLTRPPSGMGKNIGDSMEHNDEIRFSDDDENRQFIDFAFADATDPNEPESVVDIMEEGRDKAAQTYLNSLFAAVGYSRITTTTANPIESDATTQNGNILTRYLINPLLSAWNSTRAQFNLNNASSDNDDRSDGNNNSNENDAQTAIFRVNFFDNRDNIKPKMLTNSGSDTNKKSNENHVDNFNYSLPLIQHTPNNVTNVILTNETTTMTMSLKENANKVNMSQSMLNVDEYIGDDHIGADKKPRNTVGAEATVEDAAAAAFRNAFLKYSNYMQHPMEYANFDTSSENVKFTQDNSNEMKSDKLVLDGAFFAGNSFDTNSSNIQMVPSKKQKTNGSMSNGNSTTIANSVIDSTESSAKSVGENAAILILEIFGTVIGMTWRAVSEIPSYFNANGQNDEDI